MLTPFLVFFQKPEEPAGGGGVAPSDRGAFELSRRRNLENPALEDAPAEHRGDVSRGIEESSIAHTPEMNPVYPERHIAGISGTAMAPEIPTVPLPERQAPARASTAGRYAGEAAGAAVLWARKARNLQQIDRHELRAEAESYIAAHPYSIFGAAVAGFLLGRLLRR